MSKGVSVLSGCRWCQVVEFDEHIRYEEAAFVLVERGAHRTAGALTLVPRQHVSMLTDLPSPEMAAVLGGLSRATGWLRDESGPCRVEVRVHPHGTRRSGHLHFHLVLTPVAGEQQPGVVAEAEPVFASLSEATSH